MKRRALLIGINKYQTLGRLSYAKQDAEAFGEVLRRRYGFAGHDINLMTCDGEGTAAAFSHYIELALSDLTKTDGLDLLVFGFWGHGFSPEANKRYLCGVDTIIDHLERTAVSMDVVKAKLSQVGADNTLLVLDCCQNKPVGRAVDAQPLSRGQEAQLCSLARDIQAVRKTGTKLTIPTVAILNSCREGQKAYEWAQRQHGIFTAHLLEQMDSDISSVSQITSLIFDPVTQTAMNLHRQPQTPFVVIEGKGDINLIDASSRFSISMPKVTVDPEEQKRTRYRDALLRAAADGEISREEWLEISALRGELGLSASVYSEVEKQLWPGTTLDQICAEYISVPKVAPIKHVAPPRTKSALPEDLSLDCGSGVKMKLKLIPDGSFIMGSNEATDEKPSHKVVITKPFYMGIYPVTQAQYKVITVRNPSDFKGDSNPVEQVSWDEANDFCKELSLITGKSIKLPTEAQWEYAARAGTTTKYSFADSESSLDLYGWVKGNSENRTHPVGQKRSNPWGLYDMNGNVWEWCYDWYGEKFYSESDRQDPVNLQCWSSRVLRGGSWGSEPCRCRSASRYWYNPINIASIFGFRVVWLP